jgi:transketolase
MGKSLENLIEIALSGLNKRESNQLKVNHAFINHIDIECLKTALQNTNGKLITIEDHQVMGGMGSIILHALHSNGIKFNAKTLGINGEFGQSAYKADQLYARFDLNAEGIIKAYRSLM